MNDYISRQAAIDALDVLCQDHRYRIPGKRETYSQYNEAWQDALDRAEGAIGNLPSVQPEIIRCKDCKHWRQQTNYQGAPLSFGFCESDYMWRSLYGETYEVSHIDTDDDFYCGYAERRTDGRD